MSVADRFSAFFQALNGHPPYAWQRELAEHVAITGRWPDISAPTGSGKSSVIEIHVFLVAEHARAGKIVRPARRLVLVAPRRVLVDDQFARAEWIAARLRDARTGEDGILAEAARALTKLKTGAEDPSEPPIGAWLLRGGVRPDTGWRRDPAACQVICSTPQMWGSRLLLRGYGATRRSRNVEAGLLGHDAVAVIDEAHLNERLVHSARVVGGLDCGPVPLQVVAMSATQAPVAGQRAVTVTEGDLQDPALGRRVLARKALEQIEVEGGARDLHRALVEQALAAHERVGPGGGSVGVFVNTVASALSVAAELRRAGEALVLCGRLRPADVARVRLERPDLLSPAGDPSVDFLVSTQSLEVGIDLDLPAVVTALASANALAQRAGRLNRSGRHDDSDPRFTVVMPVDGEGVLELRGAWTGPYSERELVDARTWLGALGGSISPWQVTRSEVPVPLRPSLPALRRVDLETLAMTSDPLSADPDPDFYLQEPQQELPQVSIIARRYLDEGLDGSVVQAMLLAAPPRAHEVAELNFGRALDRILEVVKETAWIVRATAGGLEAHRLMAGHPEPGDTLVVPDGAPICTAGVLGLGEIGGAHEPLHDVLEDGVDGSSPDRVRRLRGADVRPIVDDDPILGTRDARERLADVIDDERLVRDLRKLRLSGLEFVWCGLPGSEDEDGLLVVRDMGRSATASPRAIAPHIVTLDRHQHDVEERLRKILDKLKLGALEVPRDRLLAAARDHDSGKRHPRFQDRMGADAGEEPLAKPRPGHRPDRGEGWRHEQLSAAFAADEVTGDPLTVTLVAAHHGCGRPMFNWAPADLLAGFDDCPESVVRWVGELFGEGGAYERMRDRTQREHGVHGLTWLEALLRCADWQVSAEEVRR